MLHRAGAIELPAVRQIPLNPFERRQQPPVVPVDRTPLAGALSQIRPIELRQVRRTAEEPLFNSLIEHHHYLGYEQPVGEHLKYLVVWAQGRPIACLAWSSAPRHLGSRDRYIGWSAEARRRNIRGHRIQHAFSDFAVGAESRTWPRTFWDAWRRLLSHDWEQLYGHPVYFAETFIDPGRFRGTCYRAANWKLLGMTTGRGKDSTSKRPNRSLKEVLGYALTPHFRDLLSQ